MPNPQYGMVLRLDGADELIKNMRDPRTIAQPVRRGLSQMGLAVQREAQLRVPVNEGRLKSSIDIELDKARLPRWIKVGPKVFYGIFVEFGTGIFGPKRRRIRPKVKKALAWGRDLGGGQKEFVRGSVKGMKPRPYMEPGLRAARPRINRILADTGKLIVRRIARGR